MGSRSRLNTAGSGAPGWTLGNGRAPAPVSSVCVCDAHRATRSSCSTAVARTTEAAATLRLFLAPFPSVCLGASFLQLLLSAWGDLRMPASTPPALAVCRRPNQWAAQRACAVNATDARPCRHATPSISSSAGTPGHPVPHPGTCPGSLCLGVCLLRRLKRSRSEAQYTPPRFHVVRGMLPAPARRAFRRLRRSTTDSTAEAKGGRRPSEAGTPHAAPKRPRTSEVAGRKR